MTLQSERLPSRELRRAPRFEYDRRAWCEHRRLTLYLAVVNLSRGGLFLQTGTPLEPGERLKVSLPDGRQTVQLEAEIVWSTGRRPEAGLGCRIVSFLEGGELYPALLERLRRSSERGMSDARGCSLSAVSR